MIRYIREPNDAATDATWRDPLDVIQSFERDLETTDFGLKIKSRNIFYFLYLKDKLSKHWGFSIMIGDKTIVDWGNSK